MCYDISFTVNLRQLDDYFPDLIYDVQLEINFEQSVHVIGHNYGEYAVIYRNREDFKLHLTLMEWGCIPFFIKDEASYLKKRATMLNARSERVLGDEKSYWFKIKGRRCLIPVTGFYEHRAIKGWKNKVPYYIRLKNQSVFFIPGLYSVVDLPDKETGEIKKRYTYTLITRAANDLMKNIHNDGDNRWRMPLMVPFEMSKRWLDEDLSLEEYQQILDYEMPSEELDYHPVFTIRGRKPREDGKAKNEYWEWAKLPPLGELNPEPLPM